MDTLNVADFVNNLLSEAIQAKSSDIHVETKKDGLKIRFRIDGILLERLDLDVNNQTANQIVSRIKVLANIDTSKTRVPNDGKFSYKSNDSVIDLRVSTYPTVLGEKVVIRILEKDQKLISLENLGLANNSFQQFLHIIKKPNGLILVTGPTGSGKTTTLYSIISLLKSAEKNILTLEDPVEYFIDGISQGQVNNEAGFSFANGIRSMLRQDPDIILIGEIRDKESAQIAMEASLTGHLVLSSLHTNDATSAIIRLMEMDIEPYLINTTLLCVLAQRLVRKNCTTCATAEHSLLFDKPIFKGAGCANCNATGYKERIGVFELLEFNEQLKELVQHHCNVELLKKEATKQGMKTLLQDGLEKVAQGLISYEELLRVIN